MKREFKLFVTDIVVPFYELLIVPRGSFRGSAAPSCPGRHSNCYHHPLTCSSLCWSFLSGRPAEAGSTGPTRVTDVCVYVCMCVFKESEYASIQHFTCDDPLPPTYRWRRPLTHYTPLTTVSVSPPRSLLILSLIFICALILAYLCLSTS